MNVSEVRQGGPEQRPPHHLAATEIAQDIGEDDRAISQRIRHKQTITHSVMPRRKKERLLRAVI